MHPDPLELDAARGPVERRARRRARSPGPCPCGRHQPQPQVCGCGRGAGDRGRDGVPRPPRPALPRAGVRSVLGRLSRVLRRQAAIRARAASAHGRRHPDRDFHFQRAGRAGRLRTAARPGRDSRPHRGRLARDALAGKRAPPRSGDPGRAARPVRGPAQAARRLRPRGPGRRGDRARRGRRRNLARAREGRVPPLADLGPARSARQARERQLRLELRLLRPELPPQDDRRAPHQGAEATAVLARHHAPLRRGRPVDRPAFVRRLR